MAKKETEKEPVKQSGNPDDHVYAGGEVAAVGNLVLFKTVGDNPLKPGQSVKIMREGVLVRLAAGPPQPYDGVVAFVEPILNDGCVLYNVTTCHVTISQCQLSGLQTEG